METCSYGDRDRCCDREPGRIPGTCGWEPKPAGSHFADRWDDLRGCVKDVKAALAKVPGVSEVGLSTGKKWIVFPDYSDAHASVTFDPQKTNVDTLIRAVEAAGNPLAKYRAQVRDK